MSPWQVATASIVAIAAFPVLTAMIWMGLLGLACVGGRMGRLGKMGASWICGFRYLGNEGVYFQEDRADCGHSCLKIVTREGLSTKPPVGLGGISMADLARSFHREGYHTLAARFSDINELLSKMEVEAGARAVLLVGERFYLSSNRLLFRPAEIFWRVLLGSYGQYARHWVVAWSYHPERTVLVIRDPFLGHLEIRPEDLEHRWLGVGLLVRKELS